MDEKASKFCIIMFQKTTSLHVGNTSMRRADCKDQTGSLAYFMPFNSLQSRYSLKLEVPYFYVSNTDEQLSHIT